MPELPEVETVRRSLEPRLLGLTINSVEVLAEKIIKQPTLAEFKQGIVGKQVVAVKRRGKYLLVELTKGQTLVVHLRMTGQFIYCQPEQVHEKHTHVIFGLSNGSELRYIDIRRFGEMHLLPTGDYGSISGLSSLGPEPLEEQFLLAEFTIALAAKQTKIKALLLDQSFLAGLGNIYVDEALFRAGVHPERPAKSLSQKEVKALYLAIREVLAEGIEHRGTSIKDYVDGEGRAGTFQERLKVYSRSGKPCLHCGHILHKAKVATRTSVFCPKCQK